MIRLETKRERRIDEEIAVLEQERTDLLSRKTIKCPKCEKGTQLSKAILINKYHYVSPHGCTGGDYHTFNEYQYLCMKCEKITRAYVGSWDRIDYREGDKLANMTEESLKDPKVQMYFFISKHKNYFGETLSDYGYNYTTLDELRAHDKKREDY